MYSYKYPRPAVTTDCVLFSEDVNGNLCVPLIQRGDEPFKGCWAFPGGFLNMDEDAESGARRELLEETGLEVDSIEQVGCFSAVDRDPRGRTISIAFYAFVPMADAHGGDDAADARWFPVRALPALAFDHDMMLQAALKKMRETKR